MKSTNKIELPVNYNDLTSKTRWRVREAYVQKQKGLCYCCEQPLDGPPAWQIQEVPIHEQLFPSNFFTWPIHLHHDHSTGFTIGAVHARCNAFMWEYMGE